MTTYKCNNGSCTGFPIVIGRCLNTVEAYFEETF